ncbi:hypothetical protein PGB90_007157 [Kerria lacca]
MSTFLRFIIFVFFITFVNAVFRRKIEKLKCPKVKSSKFFDFEQLPGNWYVIEYYASSEESQIYRCMRTNFYLSPTDPEISMNFTFSFTDDPENEQLYGNITWRIPNGQQPSHWVHSEDPSDEIIDTLFRETIHIDNSWLLLLHCAEKSSSSRYLSTFIMSHQSTLPINVMSYLRDKLPFYDIDLQYLFKMEQNDCTPLQTPLFYLTINQMKQSVKHPLKHSD